METYLVHHGILGQKWGLRRYQNADGTLTDAGKKRYSAKIEKKESRNERLAKKQLRYQTKSDRFEKKKTQYHARFDVGPYAAPSERKYGKYLLKSDKYAKKAMKTDDDAKKDKYETVSALYKYKADKNKIRANQLAAVAPYSNKAMRYMKKADKYNMKASEMGYKILRNERYINRLLKDMDQPTMDAGQKAIDKLLSDMKRSSQTPDERRAMEDYFFSTKEGKASTKHDAKIGGLDKDYMYDKMEELAARDPEFKKMYKG